MAAQILALGLLSFLTPALAYPRGAEPYGNGTESYHPTGTIGGTGFPHGPPNRTTSVLKRTAGPEPIGADSSVCSGPVTETTTEKVYITVTPSDSAAASSTLSANGTVGTGSAFPTIEKKRVRSYGRTNKVTSSSSVAASATSAVASSSAASSSSPSSKPSSGKGKRGIAYNDAGLTSCFSGSDHISWAYNWGNKPDGLTGLEYIPMLWGLGDKLLGWEQNAKDAIANGASAILAFNEPDHVTQSLLTPALAAAGYKKYVQEPFGGSDVRLGSPAVTNGGGSMGLTWLGKFLEACSDCQVDFAVIHWYDYASRVDNFKSHIQQAHEKTGLPIWITEFGAFGSDEEIKAFLEEVLPWLDSQDYVERYAYFMAKDGFLTKGTELSTYGHTFATYSG